MRATWPAATVLVTVLVLGLVLAGCGGSSSSEAVDEPTDTPSSTTTSPTTSGSTEEPPGAEEGCPYLTAEQVTAALGSAMRETAGTVNACFFDPESGEGPSVLLSRIDVQIDPAEYARQSKALCKGEVTEVEAGDMAFACVMGLGPQGQMYVDRVLVTVAIDDATDDAAGIAAAAALLPEVTVPAGDG